MQTCFGFIRVSRIKGILAALAALSFICVATLGYSSDAGATARTPFLESGDATAPAQPSEVTFSKKIFLPVTVSNFRSGGNGLPIMLGIYPTGWTGLQSTLDEEVHSLDSWAGKRLSLVGTFMGIQVPNYGTHITGHLRLIWDNGYTPFVNLMTSRSAYDIAAGKEDTALKNWARAFVAYATGDGGKRMAFIAPLPEMNGDWVSYGLHPENFQSAFRRIRRIFAEQGVPSESVRWVFAPNGYSRPEDPPFERYYPGDDQVDVVGFSSYNFGYCPANPYKNWKLAGKVFGPYASRMRSMAPTKPIFITQTGTTAYASTGFSVEKKNDWLIESYGYLAVEPAVSAILYFNIKSDCDFPIYLSGSIAYEGYSEAIRSGSFDYIQPPDLAKADLGVPLPP
jgi:hypothetical protein